MPNAVVLDNGDHWHVLMHWGGAPSSKVFSLGESAWKNYYTTDDFKAMRESHPGSIAMQIPIAKTGLWKKDWSGPHETPKMIQEKEAAQARAQRLQAARDKLKADTNKALPQKEQNQILLDLMGDE